MSEKLTNSSHNLLHHSIGVYMLERSTVGSLSSDLKAVEKELEEAAALHLDTGVIAEDQVNKLAILSSRFSGCIKDILGQI